VHSDLGQDHQVAAVAAAAVSVGGGFCCPLNGCNLLSAHNTLQGVTPSVHPCLQSTTPAAVVYGRKMSRCDGGNMPAAAAAAEPALQYPATDDLSQLHQQWTYNGISVA